MNKVESDIVDAMDNLYDIQRILRCVWGAAPLLASDLESGEAITLTLDMVFERMEAVEGKLEAARESGKAAPRVSRPTVSARAYPEKKGSLRTQHHTGMQTVTPGVTLRHFED